MEKILPILPLLAVIIVSGCVSQYQPSATPPAGSGETGTPAETGGATVEFTDQGYSPQTITIKRGETVTWVNKASAPTWPASAFHPTHTAYPGSDIAKCNTPEQEGIFDACAAIPPGGEWSFTFNEVGSWKYHDHLNPKFFGAVNVEG